MGPDQEVSLNSVQSISKWKPIVVVLLVVLGYLVSGVFGYSVVKAINKGVAQLGAVFCITLYTGSVVYNLRNSIPALRLSRETFNLSNVLLPLLGGIVVKIIEFSVYTFIFQKSIPKDPNIIFSESAPIFLLLNFATICLWVPLIEETIFRVIVIEKLLVVTPFAYLVSIILFELVHFLNYHWCQSSWLLYCTIKNEI